MWFRDRPDLLQRELDALEKAGIPFSVDEALMETRGIVRVSATVVVGGEDHNFTATYPDEYPYFKPYVTGPDLGFQHHVNPATGEYCFLATGRGAWRVDDTLAWLLTEQLEKVAAANSVDGGELEPGLEVPQAEPFSAYLYSQRPDELIIIDSALDPGELPCGFADLAYTSGGQHRAPLRGHVYALRDERGAEVRSVTPPARTVASSSLGDVRISWVQLQAQPASHKADDWWKAATDAAPWIAAHAQGVPGRAHSNHSQATQIVIVGFPEETGHRTPGQGWIGLVRQREKVRKPWSSARFVHVERAGHGDLYQREPRLTAIKDARIAVVGLGGIGSHLVPLLGCMAPGHLYAVDGDVADAATAVRNPGAFAMHGRPKAQVAMDVVHATQPYTTLVAMGRRVGSPRLADDPGAQRDEDGLQSLEQIVRDVDLVIDVTADLSVQHYLSDMAGSCGVAYLRAEALPGVRAGVVALQRPDKDVCWMCWQHHLGSTIDPLPAYEPDGEVQPPGCPDPTYTGAGFDLAAIAAQTAQVAASYLTGEEGYGRLPADMFTVRFVNDEGDPVPATWQTHVLGRHPACDNHGVTPTSGHGELPV